MPDNLTTPVADATVLAAKDIGGVKFPQNLLNDAAGADAMGLVTATPAANTLLGRLKAIADLLALTNGFVDQLEGHLDGVEGLLAAPTPAGENYIGKTGGDVLVCAPVAPPATSAGTYAAGNVLGTKFQFPGVARAAGAASLIQAASVLCKSANTAQIDLIVFSADPTASTFTDKVALNVAPADYDKVIGVVSLSSWTSVGAAALGQNLAVGLPFRLPTGTSLFAVMVARGAIALASTSDLLPTVRIIPG